MKNLIYACMALCFFTSIASAQKITKEQLQGHWTLLGFASGPVYFDLVKQDIIIPEEIKAQVPPEAEAEMRMALPMLEGSYLEVKDNKITMTLGPDGQDGVFTLTEKDSKQIMQITLEDNTSDESEIFMKDKELHLVQYTDGVKEAEFIYSKK